MVEKWRGLTEPTTPVVDQLVQPAQGKDHVEVLLGGRVVDVEV